MTRKAADARSGSERQGRARASASLSARRRPLRRGPEPGSANGQLRVTWVKGTGGVVAIVKGIRAEAPDVELDVATQTMSLKGGVRLTRGEGWITADRATVHLTTGKVSMTEVKGSLPIGSAAVEPKR